MPVYFAANPLQPLINFFEQILIWFHDLGIGWGMAIVCLTVLIRLLLLPLTLKQFKSMQSMARLQPEIKKLQDRYKNDKERLNQEMMRFYRENKVNPFASCLPMVAQLPVFLSLFYMLREAFWQEAERLPGDSDYVVVARPDAKGLAEREGEGGVRRSLAELVDGMGGARRPGGADA